MNMIQCECDKTNACSFQLVKGTSTPCEKEEGQSQAVLDPDNVQCGHVILDFAKYMDHMGCFVHDDDFLWENGIIKDPALDKEVILKTGVTPEWCWHKVELCQRVMKEGYPNAWGARIPVYSPWNLELFKSLLHDYHDWEIMEWLTYGWPISRPPNWKDPIPTFCNHTSANLFPSEINKYVDKELGREGICGPFFGVPFHNRVGVSPLSTRDKKESKDKRIIMDLSWPIGDSVNSGLWALQPNSVSLP